MIQHNASHHGEKTGQKWLMGFHGSTRFARSPLDPTDLSMGIQFFKEIFLVNTIKEFGIKLGREFKDGREENNAP